jgi:small-conductance mechanosensitive channel
MQPQASLLVSLGIPGLALATLATITWGVHQLPECGPRWARSFAGAASLWLLATAALAYSGLLQRFDRFPPPFFFLFVGMFVLVVSAARSRFGRTLALETPVPWLVGFHAFRLPLELVMHAAADEGTMPVQMTFTGWNFDIITGTTAIPLALMLAREHSRNPRALLLAWNLLGSLLLAAIIVIAIASFPNIHAFGSDPSRLNTWVAYFPFVWLPLVLVAAALFGHLLLWRRLFATASNPRHDLQPMTQ